MLTPKQNPNRGSQHSTYTQEKMASAYLFFFFFSLICTVYVQPVSFAFATTCFFLLIKIRKKFSSKVIGWGIIIFEMKSNSEDSADVFVCVQNAIHFGSSAYYSRYDICSLLYFPVDMQSRNHFGRAYTHTHNTLYRRYYALPEGSLGPKATRPWAKPQM
jgi:hypothetical protein